MATTKNNALYVGGGAPMPEKGDVTIGITTTLWAGTLGAVLNDAERICKLKRGVMCTANSYIQATAGMAAAGALLSLVVTDGVTTKTVIHQTNIPVAGGLARPSKTSAIEDGVNFVIPAKGWWAELRAAGAFGTPAAGTIKVGLGICGHRTGSTITE